MKIGNFIDPLTGEQDWLDLKTAGRVVPSPTIIKSMLHNEDIIIDFSFSYNREADKIIMLAKTRDANYGSSKQFDPMAFAEEIASLTYEKRSLSESSLFEQNKEALITLIEHEMCMDGELISGKTIRSLGFIKIQEDNIATFESAFFDLESAETKTVVIKDCVGAVTLSSLMGLEGEIVKDGYKTKFKVESVIDEVAIGQVKECKLLVDNIVRKKTSYAEDTSEFNSVEELVAERSKLLSSAKIEDVFEDTRFDDFF